MGGNQRHGEKGPDRKQSECQDCSQTFVHGKFTHYDLCKSCREQRRENSELETTVEGFREDGDMYISVTICNPTEVSMTVPVQPLESEDNVSTIGHVQVKSDDFYAENVIVYYNRINSGLKVKSNSTSSFEFKLEGGELTQSNKPTVKYHGVIGEDVREFNKNQSGEWESSDLQIQFDPCTKSQEELDPATNTFTSVKDAYTV